MRLLARSVALLVAGPVLIGAALRFGYPPLVVLGAAALLAVPVAVLYLVRRPALSVARVVAPDRVQRGEASTATLTVRNTGRFAAGPLVARDRCGGDRVSVPLPRLSPRHDTTTTYAVPTAVRGVVHVGPLNLVRTDPLGLVRWVRTLGGTARVWVYPRAYPLTAVPVGVMRSLDGRIDRVPHGSITFDSLREYVVGDELRRVHWRTSARIGELMVREHLDTSLPRLVVLLDDRAGAYPSGEPGGTTDSFEAACEAAASVIAAAAREELPVALRLVSGPGAGGDGRRLGLTTTSRDLLDLLAEAVLVDEHRRGPPRLVEAAARLRQRTAGDTLIFLTGPAGAADLGAVAGLRGAYPSIVVGALGVAEPPAVEHGLLVLTAGTGEEFAQAWDGVRTW
jgi:uncharacterized protein (DUF58 family)